MKDMESILSIIATIISSMALIGVAVSLLLQNRQLRATQIQVVRELHLELVKIGIENPNLVASVYGELGLLNLPVAAFLNLQINLWRSAYSLNDMTRESIALQLADLFKGEQVRQWWEAARESYTIGATTRKHRDFLAIIDNEYYSALRALQSSTQPDSSLPTRTSSLEEQL